AARAITAAVSRSARCRNQPAAISIGFVSDMWWSSPERCGARQACTRRGYQVRCHEERSRAHWRSAVRYNEPGPAIRRARVEDRGLNSSLVDLEVALALPVRNVGAEGVPIGGLGLDQALEDVVAKRLANDVA